MGLPVRIDSDLYDQAKSHAHAERRTISGQIEFWAMIGKAALDNPDLPIDFVRDLMIAKGEGKSLATPLHSTKQALMASKQIQVTQSSAFARGYKNYIKDKNRTWTQQLMRSLPIHLQVSQSAVT